MTSDQLPDIFINLVLYATINSFVVYGIKSTISAIFNKENLNRFIGLGLTYAAGIIQGFTLGKDVHLPIWMKILFGLFIGSISVGIYKSAIQALLSLVPGIVNKFFGSNISTTSTNGQQIKPTTDTPVPILEGKK